MIKIIGVKDLFLFIFVLNKKFSELRLSDCTHMTTGTVKEIEESDFDNKLLEYGIVPGAVITILNRAPLNGPIYIALDSQRIAIRKKEAAHIILE